MAQFLIGTIPFVGHVTPLIPIARQLVQRGHDVRWYTGQRFRPRVEATGAHYLPMQAAVDFDDRDLNATFPARAALRGPAQFKWDLKHIFLNPAIAHIQDLTTILRAFPADVLLCDTAFTAASMLSARGSPPWAVVSPSALTINSRDTAPFGLGLPPSATPLGRLRNRALAWLFHHVLFRDVTTHGNTIRAQLGLPPSAQSIFDQATSPYLCLQGSTPAFEYPRSDLPLQVHFVGPFLPTPPVEWTPPGWWEELTAGRPVVHVTQGTIATEADMLIQPTLAALKDEDLLVVATTGGKPVDERELGPLPANARVASFIPHHFLLPHVDVMITNGGYNGVLIALAHGVPLVAAGRTEEKPEICTRIAWAGVGINLKTDRPAPDRLRAVVKQILADPHYRQRTAAIAADFARHDAPLEASMLLEQLAATKQPVLRPVGMADDSRQRAAVPVER